MSTKEVIIEYLEIALRWTYKWLTDNDEILGKILYTLHVIALLVIIILIVISHVIYPVFWFQCFVFLIVLTVWLQHVLLRSCVCSSLERRLMGNDAPLAIDGILKMLGMSPSKENRMGVTLLTSSIAVGLLGLELVARGVMYFRSELELSPWG